MADTVVQLGTFAFQDFEVPEAIPFGGEQDTASHKLIGGKKVIDSLGYFQGDMEWAGRFRGPDAVSRAQALEAIFNAGAQVALTFGALAYLVMPKAFKPVYARYYEVPYTLTLEVISNRASPVTSSVEVTVDDQVNSDLATATSYGTAVSDSTLTSNLSSVSSAVAAVPTFVGATSAQLTSVLGPIATALARTSALIASNESVVTSVYTFAGLLPGGNVASMAAGAVAQATAMSTLANLTSLRSVLTRMQINLQADGASGTTKAIGGGNLYALAADAYNDPSEWVTIAKANGLTDPMLTGLNTLTIPATPDGTDGVWPT